MGITIAFFHSRGTCWRFSDLLKRVVRGPTIPGPASFSNWYGISSGPDYLLAGRDRRALPTSDAQMLSKVKTEDRMEGQTGKASWLREAFELLNVSFSNSAFPLSEPTILSEGFSVQARSVAYPLLWSSLFFLSKWGLRKIRSLSRVAKGEFNTNKTLLKENFNTIKILLNKWENYTPLKSP